VTEPDEASPAVTYSSYLALDELLGAQRPQSDEHDEMLFIVIHQVYELWFKQLIHELGHLQQRLEAGDTPHVLHTLKRVLTILKVVVAQIDVLETMTPRQFLGFRIRLEASSGFQSAQFRELEAILGRRDRKAYEHIPPGSAARERIVAAMKRPSLFDSFLLYLATQGYDVPAEELDRDVEHPREPSVEVHVDEGVQEWRYRHVKMVERTIGSKPGTGGTSGAAYLRTTLSKPVFPELWGVRGEL
jgi:tryptophan 2,3-dioxygenase